MPFLPTAYQHIFNTEVTAHLHMLSKQTHTVKEKRTVTCTARCLWKNNHLLPNDFHFPAYDYKRELAAVTDEEMSQSNPNSDDGD